MNTVIPATGWAVQVDAQGTAKSSKGLLLSIAFVISSLPSNSETLLLTTNPAPASKWPAVISFSLLVTFHNEMSSNTSFYALDLM